MIQNNKAKLFCKHYFIAVFISFVTIICINYFVDPYGIFGKIKNTDMNLKNPKIEKNDRMHKAFALKQIQPQAIVLGSSRAEYGFDPNHKGWKAIKVYNAALAGSNIYETMMYFKSANRKNNLQQVVLALDFYMFNIYRENVITFNEDYIVNSEFLRIYNLFSIIFSIDTIRDSYSTIFGQYVEALHFSNGQRNWLRLENDHINSGKGYRKSFIHSEKEFSSKVWLPAPFMKYEFQNKNQNTFDYYEEILRESYKSDIDLKILISPSHARLWEALYTVGLWPKFEDWKKRLLILNNEEAKKKNKVPFKLWDFSGYSQYTTENVPNLLDLESKMKWYWEASHYKKELGDIILDEIFAIDKSAKDFSNGFGVVLTLENIDKHLSTVRKNQEKYRLSHPIDVSEVKKYSPK
jgi:hypothetical protein